MKRTCTEPRKSRRDSLLSSEGAAFGESSLSTGRLAQNGRTSSADDDCLGVREDGGDGEAAWALDIHEERSGSWDKVLCRKVRLCSF
jgi:hypothetical protein